MNLTEFSYLLNNPNNVSPTQITELNSILKVYPYFQSARSLYLKGLQKHDNIKYNTSLKKTAAYTTDRSILFDLITSEDDDNFNEKFYSNLKENILNARTYALAEDVESTVVESFTT